MHLRKTILLCAILFLPACEKAAAPMPDHGFVQGRARVVSVDQALGQAVLEIGGRQIYAYWQTETLAARGGTIVNNGPLKPVSGDYREPVVKEQTFPAKPGEFINYVGMQTGSDLLLTGVAVAGR